MKSIFEELGGIYKQVGDYLLPDVEVPENPEIRNGFKELDEFLEGLSLDNNNAVWNLCCQLCTAYERKAFLDGLQYGVHLMTELKGL